MPNFGRDTHLEMSRWVLFFYKSNRRELKIKLPLSSGVWTLAFARQSASFALATTHSQDVLFNASRPYRRSNNPLAHIVRLTKQII